MKPITLQFTGMNNVNDPADLVPAKGEACDLLNVDHNSRGGVSRRKGYALIQSGAFRGGWSDGKRAYVARGNGVYQFDGMTFTVTNTLLNGIGPVAFCAVNDEVVFSSDSELGIVGVPFGTVRNDPYVVAMAPGACLAFMGSRLFSAKGNVVRCSKSYDVEHMDSRRNRVLVERDEIRMMLPVDDGLYVVTASRAVFMAGLDPFDGGGWQMRQVTSYGGVRGTGCVTDAERLQFLNNVSGKVALWTSTDGVCAGLTGGQVLNLSRGKVSFDTGPAGGAMIREQSGMNHYLSSFRTTDTARNHY